MARIKSHPFMGRRVCVPLYRPDESPNLLLSPLAGSKKHPTGSKNTQLGAKTPNWEQKHPTGSFYVLQKLTDTFLVTLFAV
ncbi:hypothetical protein BC792_13316 [Sphingobacterium allocomposti]|uniref:Uncharacterized protein n=1 Tax=Sphingobacterium allocomposti TaxID=415956 RepID=A0A5S5CVI8_9SPHI|nr:hypothetical protein BC792_13316 [Sphingobacterium composti Yoo et al. 2007 non Ten et al. 2007]